MLRSLSIRNFKRFDDVDIDLDSPVLFIGPNNSGKTTALQALGLWSHAVAKWIEKRGGGEVPAKRPGVTVNRKDLFLLPVADSKLLWKNVSVQTGGGGKSEKVYIEILVSGISDDGDEWSCGFEFYHANEESFYCRPLCFDGANSFMPVPEHAAAVSVAFLPPMSGLASDETLLQEGRLNVLIGEGRTAEALRNLCHLVHSESPDDWRRLTEHMQALFGIHLDPPDYVVERGELFMRYREEDNMLDLSCAGRGLQQTLLLLAYMYRNKGAVILLDEPDAHLEILRQRQIYNILVEVARETSGQIIAASHSEVLLNEAAQRDAVVAFVGKPHRLDDRGSQLRKALQDIGWEDFYQAEQRGWILYLEGSTDLSVLAEFARRLQHEASTVLDAPFVRYVGNQPSKAAEHFYGLREALPDLKGVALFDRLEKEEHPGGFEVLEWRKREIENYLCAPATLMAYAATSPLDAIADSGLFEESERNRRVSAMKEAVDSIADAYARLNNGAEPWGDDVKTSDDFLRPLFKAYFEALGVRPAIEKNEYHLLARFVPQDGIDPEIEEKLDRILNVAKSASPRDS